MFESIMIKINYDKCCWKDGKSTSKGGKACVGCVEVCPVGAITRKKKVEIDKNSCIDCGACVASCKNGALSMKL